MALLATALLTTVLHSLPPYLQRILARVEISGINMSACIYIPSGIYRIASHHLPTFFRNGCVIGDGSLKSILLLNFSSYEGDLFSWSEAWMGKSYPFHGQTVDLQSQSAGPEVRGLSIVGNRSARTSQNALVFYDRNDFVSVEDVSVHYLRGRCLFSGVTKNSTEAFLRESRFQTSAASTTATTIFPPSNLTRRASMIQATK